MSRRQMLARAGGGFGSLALAGLMSDQRLLASPGTSAGGSKLPLLSRPPHFACRAKSVIFLFMYGGPSHVDLFDYKPDLTKHAGKKVGEVVDTKGARSSGGLFPSPYKFAQHGQSGHWVSDRYPHLSGVIDRTAMLRGVYGHSISHAPALFELNTGMIRTGFPSLGSWVTYGLGTENQDLPGFGSGFFLKETLVFFYRAVGAAEIGPGFFLKRSYQKRRRKVRGFPDPGSGFF